MNTDDIKQYLKDNLRIEVKRGHWTYPNERTVNVLIEGEIIAATSFDVVQRPEYEG